VRAERASQPLIITFVAEVIAALRVRRNRGIVFFGRQIDRTTAPPAAHHLGRDQFLTALFVRTVERLGSGRQVPRRRNILVRLRNTT
jgi:hypothetical protein